MGCSPAFSPRLTICVAQEGFNKKINVCFKVNPYLVITPLHMISISLTYKAVSYTSTSQKLKTEDANVIDRELRKAYRGGPAL